MSKEIVTMTVDEAIKEGYTLYGRSGLEYQSLWPLVDFDEADWEDESKLILAAKGPFHHKISARELMDFAVEDYLNNDQIYDDTNEMEEIIKKNTVMFEEMATKINELYSQRQYYKMTDIRLVKTKES